MDRKSNSDSPLVIGLLGGVASGKSTVAKLFAEQGFVPIDADQHARRVVKDPHVRAALRSRFGPGIFQADGSLDRAALAAVVFSAPEAKRDLEAITHPAVRQGITKQLDAALTKGCPVLLDVPLLLEGGLIELCSFCVYVDTPVSQRLAQAARRGWDEEELRRREANQSPLAVKRSAAKYTIDNSGSLQRTRDQVDALLRAERSTE